jgi:hypothetical protein
MGRAASKKFITAKIEFSDFFWRQNHDFFRKPVRD